jgi:hypothetical protein
MEAINMKNVSTTVKKPLDLNNILYELRKAQGSLLALCTMLDEFGESVCWFTDKQSHDNALMVACAASSDFDTWKFVIYGARDIIADQIAALDPQEADDEVDK